VILSPIVPLLRREIKLAADHRSHALNHIGELIQITTFRRPSGQALA
jgi:hypothetical protein